jgi:hypothetical protein
MGNYGGRPRAPSANLKVADGGTPQRTASALTKTKSPADGTAAAVAAAAAATQSDATAEASAASPVSAIRPATSALTSDESAAAQMAQSLGRLFDLQRLIDCALIADADALKEAAVSAGTAIRAHSALVAVRCPQLLDASRAALLRSTPVRTLRAFLRFLYTDQVRRPLTCRRTLSRRVVCSLRRWSSRRSMKWCECCRSLRRCSEVAAQSTRACDTRASAQPTTVSHSTMRRPRSRLSDGCVSCERVQYKCVRFLTQSG